MDWTKHVEETARWLVELSRDPGWVDHARFRARELLQTGLYADLPRLMREELGDERKPEA